jgi:hypothetical protein
MNIRRSSLVAGRTRFVRLAQFDEQTEFVIPEDLSGLSVEEIESLLTEAAENARALADQERTPEVIEALTALAEGVRALRSERDERNEAASAEEEHVNALLAEIVPEETAEVVVEEQVQPEAVVEEEQEESLVASGRREVRIAPNLLRRRSPERDHEEPPAPTIANFARAAADVGGGLANGQALDYNGMGLAVANRLKGYNHRAFENAANTGQVLRDRFGTIIIDKPVDDRFIVSDVDSPERVGEVFEQAADESRLEGGTLLASGGWCAPSETLYDLYDMGESTEGMLDTPEVTVRRGGVRFPLAVDFSGIFGSVGWDYTEAQDIAGNYNGAGGGTKPCFRVSCPTFTDVRMDVEGLCVQAGLLERVGYPEVIADTVRKTLIAHAHRINAKKINALVAGSTAVTLTAGQKGATAPILTAIEQQVQHYRYSHFLNQNTVLEAVFPFWVFGAIRSDLSRREGLAEFDVPDARVRGWFTQRGIRPQFVYDWQTIAASGASGAGAFVAWPSSVKFLLYKAGTFIVGGADILTVDTLYDSTLLGVNDYTALWTEEGMLVAKRGLDSRVVTVPIEADGATHIGIDITGTGA